MWSLPRLSFPQTYAGACSESRAFALHWRGLIFHFDKQSHSGVCWWMKRFLDRGSLMASRYRSSQSCLRLQCSPSPWSRRTHLFVQTSQPKSGSLCHQRSFVCCFRIICHSSRHSLRTLVLDDGILEPFSCGFHLDRFHSSWHVALSSDSTCLRLD